MDSDKIISAEFEQIATTAYLYVIAENGSVRVEDEDGPVQPYQPNSWMFGSGTLIKVTAMPDAGYEFSHWSGDLSGRENPITFTIDGERRLIANFVPIPQPLELYSRPEGPFEVEVGEELEFHVIAEDEDATSISLRVDETTMPPGATFYIMEPVVNAKSVEGVFGWTAVNNIGSDGRIGVVFIAESADQQREVKMLEVVIEVLSQPAELRLYSKPEGPFEVEAGNQLSFSVIAEDEDASLITLTVDEDTMPEGARFDLPVYTDGSIVVPTTRALGVFSWTPGPDQAMRSPYIVSFRAVSESDDYNDREVKELDVSIMVLPRQGFTLIVIPAPDEGGRITLTPDKDIYEPGEKVVLEAIPNRGYEFSNWSGDVTGAPNPMTITVGRDLRITANFEPIMPPAPLELFVTNSDGERMDEPVEFNILENGSIEFSVTAADEDSYVGLKMEEGPEGARFEIPVWGIQPIRSISGRFTWTHPGGIIYGPYRAVFVAESFQSSSSELVKDKETEEIKRLEVLIWVRPVIDPKERILEEIKVQAAELQGIEERIKTEYSEFLQMVQIDSEEAVTIKRGDVSVRSDDPELVYYAFLVRAAVIPYYTIEPPRGVEPLELPNAHVVILISDPAQMIAGAHSIVIKIGPDMSVDELTAELERTKELIPRESAGIRLAQGGMARVMQKVTEILSDSNSSSDNYM